MQNNRLLDIMHVDQKLYLVFEYLDVDLKRYIENGNNDHTPIAPHVVKVRPFIPSLLLSGVFSLSSVFFQIPHRFSLDKHPAAQFTARRAPIPMGKDTLPTLPFTVLHHLSVLFSLFCVFFFYCSRTRRFPLPGCLTALILPRVPACGDYLDLINMRTVGVDGCSAQFRR
jgi:hypothetical protein